MSGNQPPPIGTPNSAGQSTSKADQVVAVARDLPDLIEKAASLDPPLAAKFTGEALVWSRTPWGTLAGSVIAWLAAKYGLSCGAVVAAGCWTPETANLLGGIAAMFGAWVGAYVMRYVTEHPITGFFRKATVAEVVTKQGATP